MPKGSVPTAGKSVKVNLPKGTQITGSKTVVKYDKQGRVVKTKTTPTVNRSAARTLQRMQQQQLESMNVHEYQQTKRVQALTTGADVASSVAGGTTTGLAAVKQQAQQVMPVKSISEDDRAYDPELDRYVYGTGDAFIGYGG